MLMLQRVEDLEQYCIQTSIHTYIEWSCTTNKVQVCELEQSIENSTSYTWDTVIGRQMMTSLQWKNNFPRSTGKKGLLKERLDIFIREWACLSASQLALYTAQKYRQVSCKFTNLLNISREIPVAFKIWIEFFCRLNLLKRKQICVAAKIKCLPGLSLLSCNNASRKSTRVRASRGRESGVPSWASEFTEKKHSSGLYYVSDLSR